MYKMIKIIPLITLLVLLNCFAYSEDARASILTISRAAAYQNGTYTGHSVGMGALTVTITIKDNRISEVFVDALLLLCFQNEFCLPTE